MRFLLDNNLAPTLALLLEKHGHDTAHIRDYGMQKAKDGEVLSRARQDARVLISADTDFGSLLAQNGATRPSILLIRRSYTRRASQFAALILANLAQVDEDLAAGAIVVLTDRAVRVRRLPIPPGR